MVKLDMRSLTENLTSTSCVMSGQRLDTPETGQQAGGQRVFVVIWLGSKCLYSHSGVT